MPLVVATSRHWHVALIFFFFNDTATTEIYTLSLHDALPIFTGPPRPSRGRGSRPRRSGRRGARRPPSSRSPAGDRKSTRLNSSHDQISYAVFCLKKQKEQRTGQCSGRRTPRSSPPRPRAAAG